jgi:hypothetical protein
VQRLTRYIRIPMFVSASRRHSTFTIHACHMPYRQFARFGQLIISSVAVKTAPYRVGVMPRGMLLA